MVAKTDGRQLRWDSHNQARRQHILDAAAPHRVGVERHRVFARTDQDLRAFRHLVFDLAGPYL